MDKLVAHLMENLIIDFQSDLSLENVREFLRNDNSPEARHLLAKLVEDRGVSDMLVCLADCLKDYVTTGIKPETIQENIVIYAES